VQGRTWLIGGVVAVACLAHTIPPARTMASAWSENRDAGLLLGREGAPGERVMALTPVASFYAGMSFEVMPYADVDRLVAYARHKGVRYLIADTVEFPRFRPQLVSLLDPRTAPPDLIALHTVGAGAERRLIVYGLRRPEKEDGADVAPPLE